MSILSALNPLRTVAAATDALRLLAENRVLLYEMTKRESSERHAGQVLGPIWTIGHPLALMAVYVFIFSFVFRMKIGGTLDLPQDYTTYLLSGLIPWMAVQDGLMRGTGSVIQNASLVKQVVFPIEVLPVKSVLAAHWPQLISTALLMGYILIAQGKLPMTFALVPLLILVQIVLVSGVAYLFSSVGAYFRDLREVVQVTTLMGMYLLPVFYLPNMVPRLFRPIIYLNPFSYLIWCYQDACYFGRFEHPYAWAVLPVLAVVSLGGGYRCFQRLKGFFGNVL